MDVILKGKVTGTTQDFDSRGRLQTIGCVVQEDVSAGALNAVSSWVIYLPEHVATRYAYMLREGRNVQITGKWYMCVIEVNQYGVPEPEFVIVAESIHVL